MQIKYDKDVDVLYIALSNEQVCESDEEKQGIILDYSVAGKLVGIEVLNASKKMADPAKIEYVMSESLALS